MNAYLAEVVKKREEAAEPRIRSEEKRAFVLNLLRKGKMTLEDIAECSGLAFAEVKRLAYSRE